MPETGTSALSKLVLRVGTGIQVSGMAPSPHSCAMAGTVSHPIDAGPCRPLAGFVPSLSALVAVLYHQPSPLQALITMYFSLLLQPKNTFLFGLYLQGSALSGTSFILSPPPLPPPAAVLCQQHRAWGPA